jgi:cobalamin biosynthesis Mg chelatase CobN
MAALREEIKQTRTELGETVQALAAKADVKARAKESVEHTKAKVKAQAAEATGKVTEAVKGATHTATDAVRSAAAGVRGTAAQAGDKAHDAGGQVRRSPVPLAAVLVGVVAVVGVILIVRGRRR